MIHAKIEKGFGSFQQEIWYDTKSHQAELEIDTETEEEKDDQEINEDVEDDY